MALAWSPAAVRHSPSGLNSSTNCPPLPIWLACHCWLGSTLCPLLLGVNSSPDPPAYSSVAGELEACSWLFCPGLASPMAWVWVILVGRFSCRPWGTLLPRERR